MTAVPTTVLHTLADRKSSSGCIPEVCAVPLPNLQILRHRIAWIHDIALYHKEQEKETEDHGNPESSAFDTKLNSYSLISMAFRLFLYSVYV